MLEKNFGVVIVGGNHHNTLGVIRSLGEEGVPSSRIKVLIVGRNVSKTNIVSSSKYVDKGNVDYVDANEDVVSWLMSNTEDTFKQVVICCSDGTAEAVISEHDQLERWYETPSTRADIRELMSKDIQSEFAKRAGFRVPESMVVNTSHPCSWGLFPCISKPIKSSVAGGKSNIQISENKEELDGHLLEAKADYVQIQQYIDRAMEFQLIGCSLNAGEIIIIPGYTDILRQPKNTNTGYLRYSPISNFDFDRDAVEAFIRGIGYSGLFSLEFLRGQDGVDYFLEINMRNDGNAYCVKTAGVNLPFIWAYHQAVGRLPELPVEFDDAIYFIPDYSDILRGIKKEGIAGWVKQFARSESHSVFNRYDIAPFVVSTFGGIGKVFGRLKRAIPNMS